MMICRLLLILGSVGVAWGVVGALGVGVVAPGAVVLADDAGAAPFASLLLSPSQAAARTRLPTGSRIAIFRVRGQLREARGGCFGRTLTEGPNSPTPAGSAC